jgi:malate synthase
MYAEVGRRQAGAGVVVSGAPVEGEDAVLDTAALDFVADLERRFRARRDHLLANRRRRQLLVSSGVRLDFLAETKDIREASWSVAPAPADLCDRRVEITGPPDRKMAINALNSGAQVWMADFEDANAPVWRNLVQGQLNLVDAIERKIAYDAPNGKHYELDTERPATIVVRPRGWHLDERHVLVDDRPMSGALFDFGIYFFANARRLLDGGTGPYFYLPKMESHLEARLWSDVFGAAEAALGIPTGTVRATVLIETIWAAFEMDEILYELRAYASGLNAGRWDYLFSLVKTFRDASGGYLLPHRNAVKMTAPMMRAYTELLVHICHRRGAFAIGGMAAFVPSRSDPAVNEQALRQVAEDKRREATDGFDGSWVAHPDLVPVCRREFDAVLGSRPNQLERTRPEVMVTNDQLLDVVATPAGATEAGLRNDVSVALQYLESWLRGVGAVTVFNLMEDVATAEIARSQIWQWVHKGAVLDTGEKVTDAKVRQILAEELDAIRRARGEEKFAAGRWSDAAAVLDDVALGDDFVEFLTLQAQDLLEP